MGLPTDCAHNMYGFAYRLCAQHVWVCLQIVHTTCMGLLTDCAHNICMGLPTDCAHNICMGLPTDCVHNMYMHSGGAIGLYINSPNMNQVINN